MKNTKILLIEDEEIVRNTLKRLLSKHVAEIYTARDGRDGLNIMQDKTPDIVITDLEMPLLDGKGFIKKAKEIYPDTPVIVVTAFKELLEDISGADYFLVKPHSRKDILNAVQSCCDKMNRPHTEDTA